MVRASRSTPPTRPAVLIAATHSGAGKTTATAVVLRALRRRGLAVQPFKLGPDFIDPMYHAEATGTPSINLDLWLMGAAGVRRSFRRWSRPADISVIEAMGALYDGADGTERGSAAHLAKVLDVPVIVVLDVWGMTRTAGAILAGLAGFDPDLRIAGYLLNRVGSDKHAQLVIDALPKQHRELVLGAIPHRPELAIPERHLGLLTVAENPTSAAARDEAFQQAAERLDVDRLCRLAGVGTQRPARPPKRRRTTAPTARLAVARDPAFCFYYRENLLLLRDAGFELVEFRPTADRRLPAGVDAVYLGGGYPESFAAELAANRSLAAELRDRAAAGMPVYAECGGLIYLGRSLTVHTGQRHRMAGVLPLDVVMDPAHLAIRYVTVRTRRRSPLGGPATTARGQEFHQSRIVRADLEPDLYEVTTSDGQRYRDGYLHRNVVASYLHLHFGSNRAIVSNLLAAARSAA
ncbi:MAG TPA: cobyrinate a,c-diamide synthase [Natronosporangium sp.]